VCFGVSCQNGGIMEKYEEKKWYKNGNLQFTNSVNYNGDGSWEGWHENGNVAIQGNFEKTEQVGIWSWYNMNGNKELEINFDKLSSSFNNENSFEDLGFKCFDDYGNNVACYDIDNDRGPILNIYMQEEYWIEVNNLDENGVEYLDYETIYRWVPRSNHKWRKIFNYDDGFPVFIIE